MSTTWTEQRRISGKDIQDSERNAVNAMAVQGNTFPWKPDARAMQRKVLPAEVNEANARQCDGVQFKAKQSNVSKSNAKHEAKHMHMRRKAMQCTTMQYTTKSRSIPRNPRNSEIPGTGIPRKDSEEPRLGIASAIESLFANKRRDERGTSIKDGRGNSEDTAEGWMREDSGRGRADAGGAEGGEGGRLDGRARKERGGRLEGGTGSERVRRD